MLKGQATMPADEEKGKRWRMPQHFPHLRTELVDRVLSRTGRRVLNLNIELHPERVILRGQAATFHVKQLAQQGVREVLPEVCLENAITVS
jgi:hypothetical protein